MQLRRYIIQLFDKKERLPYLFWKINEAQSLAARKRIKAKLDKEIWRLYESPERKTARRRDG